MAALGILKEDFRFLEGQKFIQSYQAPLIYDGPPYETSFCSMCGSPTPPLEPGEFFEVPAGLLDDDPKLKPDKHIFVEFTPEWDTISGELPQFTLKQLYELRHGRSLPEGFSTKTHYESTPKE